MNSEQIYKIIQELRELANELKWSDRDNQGVIGRWQGGKERAAEAKATLLTTKFVKLKSKAAGLLNGTQPKESRRIGVIN